MKEHVKTQRDLVVIAANPYSGSLDNRPRVEHLGRALERQALTYRILWHAEERAAFWHDRGARERCCCIVAAGGDGTVGMVLNEQLAAPLAVLPLGTENLFAREFGFPINPEALAALIAGGQSRRIDLARVGNRRFALMLSAGFDAAVVHRMGQWRSDGKGVKRITRTAYVRPVVDTLIHYDYPEIEVWADGETARGRHVFVFNVSRYAVNLQLAPDARDNDGCLDWVVLQKPGRLNIAAYAAAALRGRLDRCQGVRSGKAREVRLQSNMPVPVQIDGDPTGVTPVAVTVEPQCLDIIVPK